jgi:DNA-binding transcriptional ArsR family regulator
MNGSKEDPNQRTHATARDLPRRLAEDRFYWALASPHRRRLLHYLCENEDGTVDELASVLSGWEATTSGTMQTQTDRLEIRLQLLHNHLPRLADWGLIDYDVDAGTVKLGSLHPRTVDVIQRSIEAERFATTD